MLWGIHDLDEEIAVVQALRADPPALAKRSGRRRKVFSSALQQFSELLTASSRLGPTTSPIAMFYALTQAGRAITAAHCRGPGNRYEFSGHGLRTVARDPIAATTIVPDPTDHDAITVVAEATRSPIFTAPMTLGDLWGSLPQISQAEVLGAPPGRAVRLLEPNVMPPGSPPTSACLRMTQLEAADGAEALLRGYPRGRGVVEELHNRRFSDDQVIVYLQWFGVDGSARSLAEIHETYLGDGTFYLRPALPGQDDVPNILLTTWALLHALAALARYHPVEWSTALDLDSCGAAVPLRQALTALQRKMPRLVRHALTGSWNVD